MALLQTAFRDLIRGRFLGHPIHAMLVHFPSALFPVSLALDVIGLVSSDSSFASAAFYTLAAGLAGGAAAALFGAIDYFKIPSSHPAWLKATFHGGLNVIWLFSFAALFGARLKGYPEARIASAGAIIVTAILVIGVVVANFLGGELVFRHGIGAIETDTAKAAQ